MKTAEWVHRDEWKAGGDHFLVTVARLPMPTFGDWKTTPPPRKSRWYVYAYIYPTHPYFREFDGPDEYQPAVRHLPLHCEQRFLHMHLDEDYEITSFCVGCNYYSVPGDYIYSFMATKEDAAPVFEDAERLFNFLRDWSKEAGRAAGV